MKKPDENLLIANCGIQTAEYFEHYCEDDKVVTSYELRDKLLAEKKTPHINVKSKIPGIDYACEGFQDGELIVISGPTKNGKCNAKGTKLLMFDGSIKEVQDVVVGDKLMGDDSTPRTVLSTTSGVGKMYKVISRGGIPYGCNEDHILCLSRTRTHTKKRGKPYLNKYDNQIHEIPLKEYLVLSKTQKHILKTYRVPVDFPERSVEIPPYILGLWLGDGTSTEASFTTEDDEIVDSIRQYADSLGCSVTVGRWEGNGASLYRIKRKTGQSRNPVTEALEKYGLISNKHIPEDYKVNSRKNRMEILAGIIDTDGNSVPAGTLGNAIEIVSKYEQFADDIAFIGRSLGFSVTKREVNKSIKSLGFTGTYYNVRINGDTSQIPCRLKRKLYKAYECKKDVLRTNFQIEPDGVGEYFGFVLDGNGRYLLSDFQVTHNTLLAQTFTVNFSKQKEYAGWFSYEVPARQFLDQFPILPLFYLPQKNQAQDFDWFMNRCLESYFKYNARVFFIDHLHYLVDQARIKNPSLDIGVIVRRIKRFAVENDFVIFLLCHVGKNTGEELSHKDLRDSSFIAQESDCVIMVKRTPQDGQNKAKARVEFHRRTGIMEHVVFMEKQHGLLREVIGDE